MLKYGKIMIYLIGGYMKFILNTKYYRQPTYEFNLPAGHTCPFAKECKVLVDEVSGKFTFKHNSFKCYAAAAERFPLARKSRWDNYKDILNGIKIEIPTKATHIRIHASGDFFSQEYFDKWLNVIKENPNVTFWAFTKSIRYWIERLNKIPSNFILQASRGSFDDNLIDKYNLKYAVVVKSKQEAELLGLEIDTDDYLAQQGLKSFALLDNNIKRK